MQQRRKRIRAENRPEAEMDALFLEQQADETRRLILRRGITVVGLGTIGVLAWRFIVGAGGAITAPVAGVIPRGVSRLKMSTCTDRTPR